MNKREKALDILQEMRHCRPKPLLDNINKTDKGINFIIGYLSHHETEEITAGDIAKKLNVSTARIAVLLTKMEKQGFITKNESLKDARKTIVKLTNSGLKKSEENLEELIKITYRLIDEVGEDKLYEFIEISKKMKEVIEK